jgi:hypothetical protein
VYLPGVQRKAIGATAKCTFNELSVVLLPVLEEESILEYNACYRSRRQPTKTTMCGHAHRHNNTVTAHAPYLFRQSTRDTSSNNHTVIQISLYIVHLYNCNDPQQAHCTHTVINHHVGLERIGPKRYCELRLE